MKAVRFSSSPLAGSLPRALLLGAAIALGGAVAASCSPGGGAPTGGTTSGGGSSGSGRGGGSACATECTANASAPVCDPKTGACVQCLPENDVCPAGQFCDGTANTCSMGCKADADCAAPLVCNTTTHQCVGCTVDTQCPPGSVCGAMTGTCAPGCSAAQGCAMGSTCCADACVDLKADPLHCGDCAKPCAKLDHAASPCTMGACTLGACDAGFSDCNMDPSDGCEWDVGAKGPCACKPGDTMSCYTGPVGTKGVGTCVAGTAKCDATGTSFGPCSGEVVPSFDVCNNGMDDDCDGTVDNPPDQDGDGWTACQGDCCDSVADGCGDPALVNPGAFEVGGNMVDDDCDGVVDNVLPACDSGLASNSATALDYAKAIDLCATTVENPASLAMKKWGVISGSFFKADGTGTPAAKAHSIRSAYGSGVAPLGGASFAVLSTGVAAAKTAPSNTNPAYAAFQGGQDLGITSGAPADWLAANNGNFPNAPGCPAPQGGNTVHDPIMLKLRVRAPTNAKSFSVSTFFYSSEYPEWVCSAYNDFFLTLLDSVFSPGAGQAPNPMDKNLAFYDPPPAGGPVYPVGVNLAFGNTGLFSQCLNGPTGCGTGAVAGNTNTCASTAQLTGTGFDVTNPPAEFAGDPGWCGASNKAGGGTGWLTTSGNVKPGETIELRFVIWDTGDQWYDSLVLLDNFTWSLDASTPGTHQ